MERGELIRILKDFVPTREIVTLLKNRSDKIVRLCGYQILLVGTNHYKIQVTVNLCSILVGTYLLHPTELGLLPSQS